MGYVNEGLNHGLNVNLLCEFGPICLVCVDVLEITIIATKTRTGEEGTLNN